MIDLDDLDDEHVTLMMEAAQIGIQHGLDVAEARISGRFDIEPLSWKRVELALRRERAALAGLRR